MIEADYVVVGAGAMGMAFADVILTETDATIAIVDRYGCPGGHWTRAYPFVRLHQPSAFYGVNSRPLGSGTKDTTGWNAGLYELASGAEVVAYFDQVMNQQFLPSRRVQYFPLSEYVEGGTIVSLASGKTREVKARKIVDATYLQVTVPSMRPPPFEVTNGIRCVPPSALSTLSERPDGYVVIGAGKTSVDTCLFLLANDVDPDAIRWIRPRDLWMFNRITTQIGPDFFESTVGGLALQTEAAALATSIDDLFERLEETDQLLRLDKNVRPTMFRGATVSVAEVEQLRRIDNVVRMGHVQSIDGGEIVLDGGTIPTSRGTLHIDCTADGAPKRPAVPVFTGERMTLQSVQLPTLLGAALTARVEATYDDENEKNELCSARPLPDSDIDWLRDVHHRAVTRARWNRDPDLQAWLRTCRLDPFVAAMQGVEITDARRDMLGKIGQHTPGLITNLQRLLAEVDGEDAR